MKFKKYFIGITFWAFLIISLFAIFVPFFIIWIFTFWFDKKHYATQKFTQWWCIFYVHIYPFWKVKVIDAHKLKRDVSAVAVSNHQSMLDIMVLFHTYAYFVWVSKIENFRAPVLGWVMTMNHYISLKRNDPRTFPKMYEGMKQALLRNKTIMMFPEGTRSRTNEIGRFKEGAFKAAIENKVPIVPIVLEGTGRALPKGDLSFKDKTLITVKVLDPIPYENFPSYNPTILKEYVKEIIATELEKIRNNG
jgi:1-acyl-sn-glycerol-3-phosphate acyltransferase